MTALVIGSTATRVWFPDFRPARDVDIYAAGPAVLRHFKKYGLAHQADRHTTILPDGRHVEITLARPGTGMAELLALQGQGDEQLVGLCDTYLPAADPSLLLFIKKVHSNYPRKWRKNIADYCFLTQRLGAWPLAEHYLSVYALRLAYFDRITAIKRSLTVPWSQVDFLAMDDRGRLAAVAALPAPLIGLATLAADAWVRDFVHDKVLELSTLRSERIGSRPPPTGADGGS